MKKSTEIQYIYYIYKNEIKIYPLTLLDFTPAYKEGKMLGNTKSTQMV